MTDTSSINPSRPFLVAGLAMAAFALAANVPYALLIARFGYDDILREPPLVVLSAFADGGPSLILIWLAFALCAASFVVVAGLVADAARAGGKVLPGFVLAAGAASAVAQAVGLSRWVFAVPGLAETALDPAASEGARAAAIVMYETLHQFAGVAIGEHIGQTLLAVWTAGLSWTLLKGGLGPRAFGAVGLVIAPSWLVGQTELIATVIPGMPVIEITPIAFMAWEVWVLALGVAWIFKGLRRA
jgi:Domain of unknown function (DUF4386)